MTEKVECAICGRVIAGRIPKDGDGSMLIPHRHIDPKWGNSCSGRFFEGLILDSVQPEQKENETPG